jgi:hypothetical protein
MKKAFCTKLFTHTTKWNAVALQKEIQRETRKGDTCLGMPFPASNALPGLK